MKQTLVAIGLALMVGLVPVGFISQTVSAIGLPSITDQVYATKGKVEDSVSKSGSEVENQARQATNNGNHGSGNRGSGHGNGNSGHGNNGNETEDNTPAPENRFTANKLRVCEKRQDQILTNISNISDRGAKQLEVFHAIAERTKAFYAAKNYTAQGYNELAEAVDTLYDQSLVAVNATQSAGETWSCNGTNPTAQMEQFKQAKEAEMTILATYKDKVHELLILVKNTATQATTAGGIQ